jgi:cytochrome P450
MEAFDAMLLPLGPVLLRLPLPRTRRLFAARARLDAVVGRLVAERRAGGGGGEDLLGLLVDARADGQGLNDEEIRDEAMTLFLAGHETTAVTLAWTWSLLSTAPDVEAALHEEVDRVLGGRMPAADDLDRLVYTRAVVAESMRLYPPAWAIGRRALAAFPAGGYVVPARAIVILSPWLLHRDPRWWDEPERFAPERFLGAAGEAGHEAYLPFGAGVRQCLGQGFALLEAVVVLAAMARRLRLRLVPGHPVEALPLLTLRPRFGLRMRAEPRT